MIAYKAALAGVLVALVDPRNTSRTYSQCGHCEKGNRGNQSEFRCRSCGREAHADINAAENIRQGRCKEANVTWSRIVCRIRFASGGFQPSSQALAFRQGWFTSTLSPRAGIW